MAIYGSPPPTFILSVISHLNDSTSKLFKVVTSSPYMKLSNPMPDWIPQALKAPIDKRQHLDIKAINIYFHQSYNDAVQGF